MIKGILDGILSYFKAIQIIHQRGLWAYFLLPGLISVLTMLALVGVIWFTFDGLGDWVAKIWPWDFGRRAVDITGGILYAAMLLGLYVISLKYIIIVALGPFLSPLSEKIEFSSNQREYPPNTFADNFGLMRRGLSVAIYLLLMELLITLPLYLLMLIPGAAVFLAPLIFVIQGYYAGRGNMDFVLERRFGVVASIRKSRHHAGLAIGNGMVYVFLITSIIGVFFAPIFSVAGLTVEMVKRLDAEEEQHQKGISPMI